MLCKLKANGLFHKFLKRPDIDKAYAMVGPEDSWYDTISTVHKSLAEIRQLPYEKLQIISHDGLKLQAIYYPGTTDRTMIWVHGYTSHAERESAFPGLFYHSMGFNVLIPYQRAHGISEGKYITFGPLEEMDMERWVDKINEIHPNGQILIHGLSMGGGIALDLATAELKNVKGLVVDAPSSNIAETLAGVTRHAFPESFEKILPHVYSRFQKETGADPRDFDRVDNIKSGRYPLLLSAGSEEHMDALIQQIKHNNPKDSTVVILPGCNHGNGMYKQTQMYQSAIKDFIEQNFERLENV